LRPKILFILIDGLRSDKFYGKNKTSLSPNIDSLISNGVYFDHVISSSDATRTCVGSILTADYPFRTGLNTFFNHQKSTLYFDHLKRQGYSLFATTPDVDFWQTLTKNFDGKDLFPKPYVYLFGGTGKEILKRLEYVSDFQPWIYYVHIMDLHRSVDFPLPENFQNEKFGMNSYEKMVSGIDYWIGKILEKIDLTKTLIVITSDHGDFIPISGIDHEITYIPSLVKAGQKIKKFTPKHFHSLGESTFVKIRDAVVPIRKSFLKTKLSEEEMRTLNVRGAKTGWELYDEVVITPLLFSGYGIKHSRIINQQVRQIDIFPSIVSIVGLPEIKEQIEGKSLLPAINGEKMNEEPALIENQVLDPHDNDIVIGVRTSNYKYFRDRSDKKNKSRLFDLKEDPHEKNNIVAEKPNVVQQMEDLLVKHRKNEYDFEGYSDDEKMNLKIKDELKKMGYI
jgi:arylsulfatase A-like enzyme